MKYLLQKSRLQHLIQYRNGYLVLASGSLVLNILLVVFLFFMIGRERIVVVPPEINKAFWLTSNRVSPDYLSEMVLYLNSLSFNLTPANANMQHRVLLRYVDPSYYETVKIKFIEIEDRVKKEHITMAFYPSEPPKVDANKLIARITGDLQYTVGDIQLPPQRVTYQYGFRYTQGRLTLTSFPEVKTHA
jgi:conjugal transfer pilus assembly protein TraE